MFRMIEEILFKHLVELLVISGLLMVVAVGTIGWYLQMKDRHHLVRTQTNLQTLVDALQLYSYDHPAIRVFPPDFNAGSSGVILCPVRENNLKGLAFLTTPTAYLQSIPQDPFMKQSMGKTYQAPAVLHWVRMNDADIRSTTPYTHIGWGAMSVGPSLQLPPQYSIQVLQHVPYTIELLERNLFDPSNGLNSVGILYHDSLGNRSTPEKP